MSKQWVTIQYLVNDTLHERTLPEALYGKHLIDAIEDGKKACAILGFQYVQTLLTDKKP